MNLFAHHQQLVLAAVSTLVEAGALPQGLDTRAITVEPPRDPAHGDLATNAALVLAKPARLAPRVIAEQLADRLRDDADVASVEIAGPGFLNLRLDDRVWRDMIAAILRDGADFGRSSVGAGVRVNVEYVSANPTGPMHMGHCRGAVVGDALASVLAHAGFAVAREYYINDAGSQVDTLARSAHLRYREALGETVGAIPEGLYPGEYLTPVGQSLAAQFGAAYAALPESEWLALFKRETVARMMALIKADLALLGIHHDVFASEQALHDQGLIERTLADLEARDLVYIGVLEPPKGEAPEDWEPRPQTLFRASRFGDDSDRPLRKSSGAYTYFAADIAYHRDKLERGFTRLVNVLGADHGGYVKRMVAAVAALSDGKATFDALLCQMVRLFRAGEPVKMSKRSGSFVTLADVVEEVGKDVVRFMMLTRRSDAQLDFDFARVVEQSKDNPVFYVQYAHARVRSVLRKSQELNPNLVQYMGDGTLGDALKLLDGEELALVKLLAQWPRTVIGAATSCEPHRCAFYLQEVAATFHALWNRGNDDPDRRFVKPDRPSLGVARAALCAATGQVIANGLRLLGVEPVEEMH